MGNAENISTIERTDLSRYEELKDGACGISLIRTGIIEITYNNSNTRRFRKCDLRKPDTVTLWPNSYGESETLFIHLLDRFNKHPPPKITNKKHPTYFYIR